MKISPIVLCTFALFAIPLGVAAQTAAPQTRSHGGAAHSPHSVAVQSKPSVHNVIVFVPDGLRAVSVTPSSAPAMYALGMGGVRFTNSHSIFPTFTTANASSMSTGHYPGDHGDFSNTIYTGFEVPSAASSVTPFLENDAVLGDVDEHFNGDYLNEETVLALARRAGLSTASIGKVGPTLIWDHTERTGEHTIIIDDQTGTPQGIPLNNEMKAALQRAGLPLAAPSRGDNGKAGDSATPGTKSANVEQQQYFTDAVTKAVLPAFKARKKAFALVLWSRDPDGTQHNQGDSLLSLSPGINGPTSLASIKNADNNLAQVIASLRSLGLASTTDIIVMADHGFSTISKQSKTSPAASIKYSDVPPGLLPSGFLAIDLAKALGLPLSDPDKDDVTVDLSLGQHPSRGNGLVGDDVSKPELVVAANGGSDLVYLPQADARTLAPRVVQALLAQDYVSGLFVDARLGSFPGTLPLDAINLRGSALTPIPAIAVSFATSTTGCNVPVACAVEIADTGLQQGQGMHGTFSRADTKNFMAVSGPGFRKGFVDTLPVSNADWGQTMALILSLQLPNRGHLSGRVVWEAMSAGTVPVAHSAILRSAPDAHGLITEVRVQRIGNTRYFTAAGFPGRTVGL